MSLHRLLVSFTFLAAMAEMSVAQAQAGVTADARLLPSPRVTVGDGEDWGFNTRGRFELDFVHFDNDKGGHKGGIADRRTRVGLEGFYGNWSSVVELDLTNQDDGEYHNVMVQYDDQQSWRVRMGYFKEYFGMERLDSSGFTAYVERAANETFSPQRNLGAHYTYYNDSSSATFGVFTDGFVHNPRKDKLGLTTRLTHLFTFSDRHVLHLGGAATARWMEEVGFSSGPDSAATIKVVDTGRLHDAGRMYQTGLELGYAWENLLIEGEYTYTHLERDLNPNPDFDGWYISAAWMLTGEQRQYSPADDAVFGELEPFAPFNPRKGDWGAWEVLARYQEIDLNGEGVQGGEMTAITGGINWHVNAQWQILANTTFVNTDGNAFYPDDDPVVYSMRARVRF